MKWVTCEHGAMNKAWQTVTGYKQMQQSVIEAAAAACCWAAVAWRDAADFAGAADAAAAGCEAVAVIAVPDVGVGSIDDPPPRARSCASAAVL